MHSLFIIAAILLWSGLGLVVRYAGVPVHVLIFYSLFWAVIFQSPLFLRKRFRGALPAPGTWYLIVILALFNILNSISFFYAYQKTTVANAILTHYIAPVVVAVLAYLFLQERITRRIVIALALASAGLWLMIGEATVIEVLRSIRAGGGMTPEVRGIIGGLVSGVGYAAVVIIIRVSAQRLDPYVLVFFQNLVMALALLPFVRVFPTERMWLFALTGLLHSTIAPFLYYEGMRKVNANRAAILGYFEPVGAIVLSMVFLGEWPPAAAYAGGALILVSGYLTISSDPNGGA